MIGPSETPRPIYQLIWIILSCSLAVNLADAFFELAEWYPLPSYYMALSRQGLSNGFIWQPLTSLFTYVAGLGGISFFYLIQIFFQLYILWIMGSAIISAVGNKSFFLFYFAVGIASSLIAVLFTPAVLSGAWPSILAILIVWTLFNPEQELLAFFLIPVKAKWLTLGLLGAIFLIAATHLDGATILLTFSSTLLAYIWAVVAWGGRSPFGIGERFDAFISKFRKKSDTGSKVYDLSSGKAHLTDDAFVDTMLVKISKYGENSLTWSERRRMQKISERKSRR